MTRWSFPKWAKRLFQVLLPVLILGGGVIGARALIAARPEVKKTTQQASATVVEVITVQSEDTQAVISAFGTVRAHQELSVQPQVSGSVVEQHAKLIKGGLLHAGEVLLRIDPRDYAYVVETQQGALAKAEFELELERGNQVIARREWNLLESSIETSEMGKQLALRKPHLREKQAAVAAAKSRLAKAELDLQRTTLSAPCNALVLDESVEVGQLVMSQTPVARLVCTDAFRVEVSIPMHELAWVAIPGSTQAQGSQVRVIRDLGSDKTAQRQGVVSGLLGDVSENGRMARLLVLVEDPLSRNTAQNQQLPLLLGEYVRVEIDGPRLTDVFVVPRNTLREGGRVWVKNGNNQLEIRQVEVALSRHDSLLIQSGLRDGDQVITSPLPVALSGMLLQSPSDGPSSVSSPAQPTEPSPPATDEDQDSV
jgi:RND family efflux transporter MFP subunit